MIGQHIFEETSELKLRDMVELRFLSKERTIFHSKNTVFPVIQVPQNTSPISNGRLAQVD